MTRLTHSYSALNQYENCPKRYFLQRITKAVQDEAGEAAIYGQEIHADLENRLRDNTPLPPHLGKFEALCKTLEDNCAVILPEKKLTLSDDLTPTEWDAPDAWLRSILDVLIIKGDRAVVLDWKTGKRRPDETQLRIFAIQVFKHYPEVDKITSGFVWLKDYQVDYFQYERRQFNGIWSGLAQRIQRIYNSLENDVWPAKPSGLCRYCPARHMCDEAQV